MIKMSLWHHPKTGQARVYINNLPGQRSARVWVEQQPADSFGDELNVRVMSDAHTGGESRNLKNEVEAALTELAGRRVRTWADLIDLVK